MEIGIGDALRIVVTALRGLPSWVIRKWYPPHRVAARFAVDLMSLRGFVFRFGAAIPEIDISFRYINLNPFPVRVDRIDFDIWVGQPIVKNAQVLQTRTVSPYSCDPPIQWEAGVYPTAMPHRFEFQLDSGQVEYVRAQVTDGRLVNNVAIRFDLHGLALGRPFSKLNQRIELSRDDLMGPA